MISNIHPKSSRRVVENVRELNRRHIAYSKGGNLQEASSVVRQTYRQHQQIVVTYRHVLQVRRVRMLE